MRIDKMTASFGRLKNAVLEPGGGLTVIELPNEGGKSTWCAFLRTMLYGLSTRDRGPLADKNRYAPWDGSPMRGVLSLTAEGRRITITRDTLRAGAPMGQFSAVYTGTAEPVSRLAAGDCGDVLLGVPREVFERSAFIRQSGLTVGQDAELERRIAALISTGEEDASFSEAYALLKNQLNRRRHNKTGLLPGAESELAALTRRLEEAEVLRGSLSEAQAETEALRRRETALQAELQRHAEADAAEEQRRIDALRQTAEQDVLAAQAAETALAEDGIPPEETLHRLLARADALSAAERELGAAAARGQEAADAAAKARADADAHPLAGHTPEEAAQLSLDLPPKPRMPLWCVLASVLAGAALGALTFRRGVPAALGMGLALSCLSLLVFGRLTARRQARWESALLRLRAERTESLSAYTALYEAEERTRAAAQAAAAELSVRSETAADERRGLCEGVSSFAAAASPAEAREAAAEALHRREGAKAAAALAREEKMRYDIARQSRKYPEAPHADASRPDSDPAALERELSALTLRLSELSRQSGRMEGQLREKGDTAELSARAEELRRRVETLGDEYEALALAMEALSAANTELQTRFSPELGRRTAVIFSGITGGKYDSVLLDRELNAAAGEAGGELPRSAALLSQGAADQLYLSLRLAICGLVLPEEKNIPLILDDALANFDDSRAERTLDWLAREGERRQILLFTCQSREADYLCGAAGVRVLRGGTPDAAPV